MLNQIYERVRHNLHEVKVILSCFFRLSFKTFIDFAFLAEHVEHGVLAVIDLTEVRFLDQLLYSFWTETEHIDFVIQLYFVFVIVLLSIIF